VLVLKNRVALEFFTVLNIRYTFRIFEQLAVALKNRVALIFFTVLNMYILLFRIFEQLALALKNRVALEFFTVLKYILIFRIFEQLAVALKKEFALKFFKPGDGRPPPRTPMGRDLSNSERNVVRYSRFDECKEHQSLPLLQMRRSESQLLTLFCF